jgi:hypothetical protein
MLKCSNRYLSRLQNDKTKRIYIHVYALYYFNCQSYVNDIGTVLFHLFVNFITEYYRIVKYIHQHRLRFIYIAGEYAFT